LRPPRTTLLPYTTLFRSRSSKHWRGVDLVVSARRFRSPTRKCRFAREAVLGGVARRSNPRLTPRRLAFGTSAARLHTALAASRRSEEHTSELQSQSNLVC